MYDLRFWTGSAWQVGRPLPQGYPHCRNRVPKGFEMEALLVFVAVVVIFGLPILAIIIAGRTSSRLYDLEQQLKQLRSDLRSSAARSERSAPTTIRPADEHAQTIGAQPLAPEPALSVMDAPSPCEASFPEEEFTAPPSAPDTLHTDTGEPMPTGAARPAASRRFEEQVGTRLPVWIGVNRLPRQDSSAACPSRASWPGCLCWRCSSVPATSQIPTGCFWDCSARDLWCWAALMRGMSYCPGLRPPPE